MAELFRRDDFDFLEAQPGYVPEIAARLRADRIKIARGYLNRLEREIRMLLNTANRLAVQSSEDVNDFSAFLLKKEVSFAFALTILRLRLFLMRVEFGILFRSTLLKSCSRLLQPRDSSQFPPVSARRFRAFHFIHDLH